MAYIEQTDLKGMVPDEFLLDALDDDRDGVADESAWAEIYACAEEQIHSRLEGRYTVPFSEPIPAIVREAAKMLSIEQAYARKGFQGDRNPWGTRGDAMRARLEKIGETGNLKSGLLPATQAGAVIGEKSKLYSDESGSRLMV